MTIDLPTAIEGLYDAFRSNTPDVIEGCPCCLDTRKTDILLSKPLRSISLQDMWRYTSGIFLTVGSERDFKYFLPRIFELEALAEGSIGPEIAFGKMGYCDTKSWSGEQRKALDAYFGAFMQNLIDQAQADEDNGWIQASAISGLLCGIAKAGWKLDPYLSTFGRPENATAKEYLRWDFPKRPKTFWADVPDEWRQVSDFLAT